MMHIPISRCPTVKSTTCPGIFLAVTVAMSTYLPVILGDEPTPEKSVDNSWVSQAETLVSQLSELDVEPTKNLTFVLSQEVKLADQIMWKLWLITGMPPFVSGDAKSPSCIQKNSVAYRRYIAEHKHLTFEEIQRLGLTNAINAYGSSLWYMTLRYLEERASVLGDWQIDIQTSPACVIVEHELPEEVYARLSADLSLWLRNNKKELEWDSVARQFRPRSGKYLGTDALYASLNKMLFRRN